MHSKFVHRILSQHKLRMKSNNIHREDLTVSFRAHVNTASLLTYLHYTETRVLFLGYWYFSKAQFIKDQCFFVLQAVVGNLLASRNLVRISLTHGGGGNPAGLWLSGQIQIQPKLFLFAKSLSYQCLSFFSQCRGRVIFRNVQTGPP